MSQLLIRDFMSGGRFYETMTTSTKSVSLNVINGSRFHRMVGVLAFISISGTASRFGSI